MKLIDLTGQRFGNLTAVQRIRDPDHKRTYWRCRCDCGNYTCVEGGNLRSGHTKSCGHCERYDYLDADSMMCILKTGDVFIFDREDFPLVKRYRWSIEESGYVQTMIGGRHVRMHNLLMGSVPGLCIDHINGDCADNRRKNLRFATNAENCRNQKLCIRNKTGFKGVSLDRRRGKYEACINPDGRKVFLGYFDNPKEAALAYDKAASFYFGEFARTNFGEEGLYGNTEILEMAQ